MKILSMILCIILALSLCACGVKDASSETAPTDVPDSAGSTEAPAKAPTAEETPSANEEVPAVEATEEAPDADIPIHTFIETKYYTLTLPDSWGSTCFYSVVDDMTVVLREASSYEAFGGGKLCTLMLMPTDDDTYKDFPDYELLCALDTPDGSFYVIALFPTDVQFNEDTTEAYNAMSNELMDVLYTIQPVGDIEMAMP